ncbi:UpxY family transcription antiterminator [Rubrolithibacter danxiaensis]|uniref:UpxY family transcription antiterminator n=1 Tax=Rubrolithibacter danxiaensis TaxID=3390805 RepID=UPI003BF8F498
MDNIVYSNPKIKNWRVIYTRSKWEKKVDQLLHEKGIQSFCPTVKKERQWADRKKTVEFPLFNSYIFVKVNHKEELSVRETLGVINFIYYCGKPAVVRENVIDDIQKYLNLYPDLETTSIQNIKIGDRVKIKEGVFSDQLGEVVKIEGKKILMVIEHLDCALTTKVNFENIGSI